VLLFFVWFGSRMTILSALWTTLSLASSVLLFKCYGCTNLLCTKGATSDGSNIIAYNADAANFYTTIYHYPAGKHEANETRKMWTWE
jgi:hypothetical protein